MRTLSNNKMLIFALTLLTGMTIATASCKKSSSSTSSTTDTVSTDVAANAVTEAVTPASAGIVTQTQTATVVVSTGDFECGVTTDSSFAGSNAAGAAITYSYAFNSSRTLTCDNGIPQQFAYQFTGSSAYTAPRISSDDSSAGQFTITGLQPAATQYTFNETYIRKGSENSLVGNQMSFTSTITIQASNLIVDKSTQQILSGTAAVSISGSTSGGKSFSYSGTLTFNGSQTATLVLGSGNTYSITWS
jgi:hypothetical protein